MHNANLIWVTPDAEALIGKIARVSNPNNEDNPDVERLIKYLITQALEPIRDGPCVEIHTTRAVGMYLVKIFHSKNFRAYNPTDTPATALSSCR